MSISIVLCLCLLYFVYIYCTMSISIVLCLCLLYYVYIYCTMSIPIVLCLYLLYYVYIYCTMSISIVLCLYVVSVWSENWQLIQKNGRYFWTWQYRPLWEGNCLIRHGYRQTELLEPPLDFCLWGWMKTEVDKTRVDARSELLSVIVDAAAACIQKREAQLRRSVAYREVVGGFKPPPPRNS